MDVILNTLLRSIFGRFLYNDSTRDGRGQTEDGSFVLKLSKYYIVLGIISVAFVPILSLLIIYSGIQTWQQLQDHNGLTVLITMFAIFSSVGAYLILYPIYYSITFNDEKISQLWGGKPKKTILWKDITKVFYSIGQRDLVVCSYQTKIKIDIFCTGFDRFEDMLKRKSSRDIYEQALAEADRIRNFYGGNPAFIKTSFTPSPPLSFRGGLFVFLANLTKPEN